MSQSKVWYMQKKQNKKDSADENKMVDFITIKLKEK